MVLSRGAPVSDLMGPGPVWACRCYQVDGVKWSLLQFFFFASRNKDSDKSGNSSPVQQGAKSPFTVAGKPGMFLAEINRTRTVGLFMEGLFLLVPYFSVSHGRWPTDVETFPYVKWSRLRDVSEL